MLRPLVGSMVSGSVSSPNRGSSHLSVTILSSLSVAGEYLALGDGPPRFRPGSTCPALLGAPSGMGANNFAYGTVTLCGLPFQTCSAVVHTGPLESTPRPRRDNSRRFRLVPVRSPLLRESRLLSFPPGTEMFQFPGFAASAYVFSRD